MSDQSPDFYVGQEFESYEELESFVRCYEQTRYVQLNKCNGRSLANARLRCVKRSIQDRLKYYELVLSCVHYGDFRSTSKGIRPNQSTCKIGCKMKVRLCASSCGNYLVVTKAVTEHNHDTSQESFNRLARQRKLGPQEKAIAMQMLAIGAGKKSVKRHFSALGKRVTTRELHLMLRGKQELADNSSETVEWLRSQPGAEVHLFGKQHPDGTADLLGIFYQDERMKLAFKHYPELLFVDTACLTNQGISVFVLAVEDGNGDNEIAGFWTVKSYCKDTVRALLQQWKESNPDWEQMKVVLAAKEFNQRDVFREELDAKLELCLPYVLNAFQRAAQREANSQFIMEAFEKVAHSASEASYAVNKELFEMVSSPRIVELFNTTWHPMRSEWVIGLRLCNFGDNSGSRFDSLRQKLKTTASQNDNFRQFVEQLLKLIATTRLERSNKIATMISKTPIRAFTPGSTEDMYSKTLTPYVLAKVLNELGKAMSASGHLLDETTSFSCSCPFFEHFALPCRHIFVRRNKEKEDLFALELCPKRWTLEFYRQCLQVDNSPSEAGQSEAADFAGHILTTEEKYGGAFRICQELASLLSECPDAEFESRMGVLQWILDQWQCGQEVNIYSTELGCRLQSSAANPAVASSLQPEDFVEVEVSGIGEDSRTFDDDTEESDIEHSENQTAASNKTATPRQPQHLPLTSVIAQNGSSLQRQSQQQQLRATSSSTAANETAAQRQSQQLRTTSSTAANETAAQRQSQQLRTTTSTAANETAAQRQSQQLRTTSSTAANETAAQRQSQQQQQTRENNSTAANESAASKSGPKIRIVTVEEWLESYRLQQTALSQVRASDSASIVSASQADALTRRVLSASTSQQLGEASVRRESNIASVTPTRIVSVGSVSRTPSQTPQPSGIIIGASKQANAQRRRLSTSATLPAPTLSEAASVRLVVHQRNQTSASPTASQDAPFQHVHHQSSGAALANQPTSPGMRLPVKVARPVHGSLDQEVAAVDRGSPKGKRARPELAVFSDMSDRQRLFISLLWITDFDSAVQAMDLGYRLRPDDLQVKPVLRDHWIAVENRLSRHLLPSALQQLRLSLECLSVGDHLCNLCFRPLASSSSSSSGGSVACRCCLARVHLKCEGLARMPRWQKYFCTSCTSVDVMRY